MKYLFRSGGEVQTASSAPEAPVTAEINEPKPKGEVLTVEKGLEAKLGSPKVRLDQLLIDIKSGGEEAQAAADIVALTGEPLDATEKVPTDTDMADRLRGIPGALFLELPKEDLRLLFTDPANGPEFNVDFHDNKEAYYLIGAADILDKGAEAPEFVMIDGQVGHRENYEGRKVGYVTSDGEYLKIDTKTHINSDVPEGEITKYTDRLKAQDRTLPERDMDAEEELFKSFKERAKDAQERSIERKKYQSANFQEYVRGRFQQPDFVMDDTPVSNAELNTTFTSFPGKNKNLTFELASNFFNAISDQESGGNPAALGAPIGNPGSVHFEDQAIGEYQIMPVNWESWAGKDVPPTASNQGKVAFKRQIMYLNNWLDKGNTPDDAVRLAAVNWYGNNGKKLIGVKDISTRGDATLGKSPASYSEDMLRRTRPSIV